MESISIFDIFKIGVGPSSSHTLGPWKAAALFAKNNDFTSVDKVLVHLYGSLSKTGKGHATDKAVLLGLMGLDPKTIDTNIIEDTIKQIKTSGKIIIQSKIVSFDYDKDIIYESYEHRLHPNTVVFSAYKKDQLIHEQTFASVGGGFIESDSESSDTEDKIILPFPINQGVDILDYTHKYNCPISDIVAKNEESIRSHDEIEQALEDIIDTILDSMYVGCCTDGILPGGLNVTRRAKTICDKLLKGSTYQNRSEWLDLVKQAPKDFNSVNKWISCLALAVNEQNAAMGRIVTSPTNGAAGVIPAVLMYFVLFCDYESRDQLKHFLYTAGEIGCLFKKGATISAAMGGCQAEIGVSSAMAAAGLTEVLGGNPEQCLVAAEIAMEHHLGLTCDPINGLVQVPCIERNAMGAMKAITAANLALDTDPKKAIVHFDTVIKTMWEVAQDMKSKYKETSEGGLAINLPVINPNC